MRQHKAPRRPQLKGIEIFESTIKLETESEKMIIQIKRHLSIYFVTNNKLMILMKIICHRIRQIANIKIENNYYGE